MKSGHVIHRGQRLISRALVIVLVLICAMTLLIAFLNKDLVTGSVMMAVNLVIGGIVWGVLKLVRRMTAVLYGPPPEN